MRIANKYLQEDQSDFFAWRLRLVAADALGLQDDYLRSVQGAFRNLPEDVETCHKLVARLFDNYWNNRPLAPLLKQTAEKAISLGSDYTLNWLALSRAYEVLGDQDAAKEVSDKMDVLIEQGELEDEVGGRRYQGVGWTRRPGGEVTERSGSIDLKDGPYTWTFPTAGREAHWLNDLVARQFSTVDKELPKILGRSWFFDRNCALRLKGNWYFSENAVSGPIKALASAQTYFSKVDYQRVYVRALQPGEVDHSPWAKRYDPSLAKSLEDLQRRSTGRVRILHSKQPLPVDGVLVVVAVYVGKDPLADVSATISLSRYGSEEPFTFSKSRSEQEELSKSWSEQEDRRMRSYVYEEALRRSLDAVLPQRKDVPPVTPTLSTVGKKTRGGAPQVTLSIEYNEGSKLPMSAEQLGNALERSLDELRALVAGKAD